MTSHPRTGAFARWQDGLVQYESRGSRALAGTDTAELREGVAARLAHTNTARSLLTATPSHAHVCMYVWTRRCCHSCTSAGSRFPCSPACTNAFDHTSAVSCAAPARADSHSFAPSCLAVFLFGCFLHCRFMVNMRVCCSNDHHTLNESRIITETPLYCE
jgi:hypothetical protein